MALKRLFVFAFALAPAAAFAEGGVKITFEHPVETSVPVPEGLASRKVYQQGEGIPLDPDKITWIQAKGKVPMLVVPSKPMESADATRIRMPDLAAWPPSLVQSEIERKVSTMIEDIQNFQNAMIRKDIKEAEKILQRLESTQPIAYLYFLRASLDFVKGDVTRARIHVERGLQRLPANVQGQRLLDALNGKPSSNAEGKKR